jgi:hypothetical protein
MSPARHKSFTLALLLALSLTAGVADAEKQSTPKLPGHKARVGQGGRVDLAAPRLTVAELARLRPGYEALKPRARTNTE